MFSAQHEEMASVARAILAHVVRLAAGDPEPANDPLPALRLTLSRTVGHHCSAEIDVLNAHLKSHPQVAAERADLVRRYHDELLAWRGSLMECNPNWPARRVIENPAAFLSAFRPIAEALYERVRWEEQEFYPKVLGRAVAHA
jgi:hypothetical protein